MNSLREKRLEAGLSQRALAEKAHIPQSCLCDFERGNRKPWPKAAKRLARVLRVPVGELFPDESEVS